VIDKDTNLFRIYLLHDSNILLFVKKKIKYFQQEGVSVHNFPIAIRYLNEKYLNKWIDTR